MVNGLQAPPESELCAWRVFLRLSAVLTSRFRFIGESEGWSNQACLCSSDFLFPSLRSQAIALGLIRSAQLHPFSFSPLPPAIPGYPRTVAGEDLGGSSLSRP